MPNSYSTFLTTNIEISYTNTLLILVSLVSTSLNIVVDYYNSRDYFKVISYSS